MMKMMAEIVSNVKLGKEGHNDHFRNCLNQLNDKTRNSVVSHIQKGSKM